jgi:multiple sugar transport system permease protein
MIRRIFFYLGVVVLLVAVVFPFFWVVSTSFKTGRDAFALPPVWIFTPTFENYAKIFENQVFLRAIFNSLFISLTSSVIAVGIGSLAAYGLIQQDYGVRRKHERFILSLRIAPALVFVIPMYYFAARLGALNSYWLLLVVYAFINTPFAISLLLTFFEDVPKEIRDAARVDGAREFAVFRHVFLPAAKGGVVATFILCVLFTWNEFFVALILAGRDTQTLPVSVTSFLTSQGIEWGTLSAAATLIMLPMLVLGMLVQGHIVRGMTLGSVKG